MAKERLSNEIIAQVLTQAVANLEKTLRKHQETIQNVANQPISVDTKELKQAYSSFTQTANEIDKSVSMHQFHLQKAENPLKKAKTVSLYTMVIACFLAVILALEVVSYFKKSITETQKQKAQFVDEVFFSGKDAQKNKAFFENWKTQKQKQ